MSDFKDELDKFLGSSAFGTDDIEGYVKLFKEGKAIVPIKKTVTITDRYRLTQKGEAKEYSEDELYRYWKADGATQQSFSANADMVVAYGSEFDIPKPMSDPLTDEDKSRIHLMELWRNYVDLDTVMKYAVICGMIFGDFYAEKVYDERGGVLSKKSWGIKSLKILDPRTMYVDRARDGRVKNYYQHPRADQMQPRSIMRSKRSIVLSPAQIIHIRFDNILNKTYGHPRLYSLLDTIDMKIGLKADAVAIAQRRSSPFLVWHIGSDDAVIPATLMEELMVNLQNQLIDVTDSDVFVPGFIKIEVIEGKGDAGNDIMPMVDFMNREIAIGAGVPDILFAGSTASGESAKAKEELWMRQIKALQNFIGNEFRNKVYVDLFYPPIKSKTGVWKSMLPTLTPEQYMSVPYNKWNIIESVADHRLRMSELTSAGLIGEEEGRKQLNLRGKLKEDDQVLPLRIKKQEADTKEKGAETKNEMGQGGGFPTRPPSRTNPKKEVKG